MNCSKQHAIPEGGKFCPECGETAPTVMAKAICAGCSTEQDGTHKHCANCGDPLVKADAELAGALDTMIEFAKAREALGERIEVPTGDHADTAALLAAEDADEAIPFLKAFIASQNILADKLDALSNEVRTMRRESGTFAKADHGALTAIGREVHDLNSRMEIIEATPGRPRSILVHPLVKAAPGTQGQQEQDTSLRGTDLVQAARQADISGKLEAGDSTLVQMYANRGATLNVLAKAEPAVYQRLAAAIPPQSH